MYPEGEDHQTEQLDNDHQNNIGQAYSTHDHESRYTASPAPSYGTQDPSTARPSAIPFVPFASRSHSQPYLGVPTPSATSGMGSYHTAYIATPTPTQPPNAGGYFNPSSSMRNSPYATPSESLAPTYQSRPLPQTLPYGTAYEPQSSHDSGTFGRNSFANADTTPARNSSYSEDGTYNIAHYYDSSPNLTRTPQFEPVQNRTPVFNQTLNPNSNAAAPRNAYGTGSNYQTYDSGY